MKIYRQRLNVVREEADAPYGTQVTAAASAAALARTILADEFQEVSLVMFFDRKRRLLGYQEIGRGGLSHCPLETREVVIAALLANADAIIVAHNHPSGEATPSADDHAVTRRIDAACTLVGLTLLDHLVIGSDDHVSVKGN